MVEPGSIVLGKYRIERILGKGGMGVVALARHVHLDEPMAIKFLQPSMLGKYDVVQRFLREARAAVKLKGEHVCRVFDVGTLDTGAPYMIMEYLHGVDLGEYIRERGALGLAVTVDISMQACAALGKPDARTGPWPCPTARTSPWIRWSRQHPSRSRNPSLGSYTSSSKPIHLVPRSDSTASACVVLPDDANEQGLARLILTRRQQSVRKKPGKREKLGQGGTLDWE